MNSAPIPKSAHRLSAKSSGEFSGLLMSHSNWSLKVILPILTLSLRTRIYSPIVGLKPLKELIYFFIYCTMSFSNAAGGKLCSSMSILAKSSKVRYGSFLSQMKISLSLLPSTSMSSFIGINVPNPLLVSIYSLSRLLGDFSKLNFVMCIVFMRGLLDIKFSK